MDQNEPVVTMPARVYQTLRSGFTAHAAEWLTHQLQDTPPGQRRLIHPGDHFGRVFAWVWRDDPNEAMLMLADYLAVLRDHNPVADLDPPVRLDDILRGLRLALPDGFEEASYDAMVAQARQQVQGYYGADPNR
jgi:hypothetical protein